MPLRFQFICFLIVVMGVIVLIARDRRKRGE
jgi:hypothetical protein